MHHHPHARMQLGVWQSGWTSTPRGSPANRHCPVLAHEWHHLTPKGVCVHSVCLPVSLLWLHQVSASTRDTNALACCLGFTSPNRSLSTVSSAKREHRAHMQQLAHLSIDANPHLNHPQPHLHALSQSLIATQRLCIPSNHKRQPPGYSGLEHGWSRAQSCTVRNLSCC